MSTGLRHPFPGSPQPYAPSTICSILRLGTFLVPKLSAPATVSGCWRAAQDIMALGGAGQEAGCAPACGRGCPLDPPLCLFLPGMLRFSGARVWAWRRRAEEQGQVSPRSGMGGGGEWWEIRLQLTLSFPTCD